MPMAATKRFDQTRTKRRRPREERIERQERTRRDGRQMRAVAQRPPAPAPGQVVRRIVRSRHRRRTNGASLEPAKTCLSRKPGSQEKSDHGFLASEFPSSAFLRGSWIPAQTSISVVKLCLFKASGIGGVFDRSSLERGIGLGEERADIFAE